MKKNLLVLLLLTLAFYSNAKDRYVMAQIVTNTDDTIVNPVKYDKLFDFQEKVEMMNDDGKLITLTPLDAKEFRVLTGKNDTIHFESNCGLKLGLADNVDQNCYFIMKLKEGKVPLYYFSLANLMSFGVSLQKVNKPSYLSKYRDEWVMMQEENYKDQIMKVIKPFKKLINKNGFDKLMKIETDIISGKFSFENIPTVFDKINAALSCD